ncbi:MAG: hypothetical protein GDA43_25260 [Hormoscilla sp. SP5CHS1]|nr:hypothetical protein [Hormoscilla sp. SP12CHS1]MBC6456080.1 hypothetical protein [Hormoscilla sp. SP5CHS1]
MPLEREPPQLLKQRMSYQGRKFGFEAKILRLPNGAISARTLVSGYLAHRRPVPWPFLPPQMGNC